MNPQNYLLLGLFLLAGMGTFGTYVLSNSLYAQSINCQSLPTQFNSGQGWTQSVCVSLNGHKHFFLDASEHYAIQLLAPPQRAMVQSTLAYHADGGYPFTAYLIVTDGFNTMIRESVGGGTGAPSRPAQVSVIAIGTGTTAAVVGDSNLQTELCNNGWTRATATYSEPATKQWRLALTFTSTDSTTRAVSEIGSFNTSTTAACSSNNTTGCTTPCMLDHIVFTADSIANGDSFTSQITFTLS